MKKQDKSPQTSQIIEKAGAKEIPVLQGIEARKESASFPVVGIGASAGGLEALKHFLDHVPTESGMAFVIVQHLDPDHKGLLVELLQRITPMKVNQVEDQMRVAPNQVYVIPPNKNMTILNGILHLFDFVTARGLRLPIDYFFRSLADDRRDRSIGVILSGMGSDGTLGLRAIKEKVGLCLVQEPASANFDGMPRSAINAGLADIIAPAAELPGKILAFLHNPRPNFQPDVPLEDKDQRALEKIFVLLRMKTGHDFSLYKPNTIYRRIERRMGLHQIGKMANYVRFLQENPQEIELLFKELLIGVTSFFRDAGVWDQLRDTVIPALLADNPAKQVIRAWVPGCSTGEEAYSLAIVFKEAQEQMKPARKVSLQIFGTDIDSDAIDKARRGFYLPNIAADVSPERLRSFFVEEDHGFRVTKEIRETVIFAPQNIIADPPFTKMDILSNRNLLIYLSAELQRKIIPLFHYSLNPGGVLLLGNSESIGTYTSLFATIDSTSRLYRKKEYAGEMHLSNFTASLATALPGALPLRDSNQTVNLQSLAEHELLRLYSPAAVLTTDLGDIVYVHGRTGKYLEPATGKANMNLLAMAREELRYELRSAFHKALGQKNAVTVKGLPVGDSGGTQIVDITLQRLEGPEPLKGMVMIVFADMPTPPETAVTRSRWSTGPSVKFVQIQRELKFAQEELQRKQEEMQASHENLTSANEELQSANEEMQSTNEELTTSKEEMQSMNEELQTINNELQSKVDQLAQAENDMKNLLNSTDIATLFLDDELNVRRFTTQASSLIKLRASDEGRPITDIAADLIYPELAEDAREVLHTMVLVEKELPTRDGRWFTVKLMPYRTQDNRLDGLVITFVDISALKKLADHRKEVAEYTQNIVDTMHEPLLILDAQLRVVSASRSYYQFFAATPEKTEKRYIYDLGNRQWDSPRLRELLEDILPKATALDHFAIERDFPVIGKRSLLLNARKIFSEDGKAEWIVLAIRDTTTGIGGEMTS